ncbi:MAG: glycosyltransferase family 4 protein [Acidobacteriota bacterium]
MNGEPVRVCHIVTRLDLGGAQQNTLYTVSHLREPFRPSLVCGPGGLLDAEARALAPIPVTFVPRLVRPIRPLSDLLALLRLTAILRRERPQIVHTHSSKAGILGRLAAWLARVPVVVHSIHGFGFHDAQPRALRALLVAVERAVAPLTSHFIAVSHANLDRGLSLGILRRDRVSLIRSGIRVAEFRGPEGRRGPRRGGGIRRELGLPEDVPLVGMIACLKPQKCPLDFVEVAARVARAVAGSAFVIAGDGELREAARRRVDALGLGGRFHLLGWRRDVPGLLAELDVMVLTSRWEGLPRVVPEAIAAGVPIVATAVDGVTDVLRDGVTGLVAPPGDIEGIASRVARLLRDPSLGIALCDRARAVLAEFDIDAMVRAQESLYARLLRRFPGAGVGADRKALSSHATY